MDPYAALAQIPLFAELPSGDLTRLGAGLRRRPYAKGAAIFRQGDAGTTLFLIESGWVKIVVTSPEGQEAVFSLLGPGDFFGDLALLDGKPRSADAVAAEESHLLLLERDAFVGAIEESPRLALGLLAALAGRLRYAVEMREDTSFLDVPGRLARILLRLATVPDQPAGATMAIPIRLTQAELAALVGATRESINKWLKVYEAQGVIRRGGARLTILRPEELRKRIG
jgi:CRP/FNR family cyclic AMP-dependent transcriptional regulator